MSETVQLFGQAIPKTAALAPMASVADTAYRLLCMEQGACMCTGELISAKGLCYGSKGSRALCQITAAERPMGIQLFGSEPEYIAAATEIILEYKPDWIDLNMGCPVPKVVNQGAGAALMRTPELAEQIVQAAVSKAKGVPVGVKMRIGWDDNHRNAVSFAQRMEAAGADAICVHGRTRMQFYGGKTDWSAIRAVKQAVAIPVIGNGDIVTGADAVQMYAETGCDLIMVGRATYGNPWVFAEIEAALAGEAYTPPDTPERLAGLLRHIRLILELSGKSETLAMREARKHALWYLKGRPGAAMFRAQCSNLQSYADAERLAAQYLEKYQTSESM